MKTLNLIIVVICVVLPLSVFSQTKNTAQIFLTNNKNYIGTLVEQKPGEYIKFLLKDSNDTLKIMMDDIEKIVKLESVNPINTTENVAKEQNIKPSSQPETTFNQRPVSLQVHYGMGGGDVSFGDLGLGLYTNLSSRGKVGLSASYFGESGYSPSRFIQWQKIPVMAEYQHDIITYSKNRMAMYTRVGAGYSFTLNGNYYDAEKLLSFRQTNGLTFNLGLGYRLNIFKNTGLLFDINYSLIMDRNKSEDNMYNARNSWDNVLFRAYIFI